MNACNQFNGCVCECEEEKMVTCISYLHQMGLHVDQMALNRTDLDLLSHFHCDAAHSLLAVEPLCERVHCIRLIMIEYLFEDYFYY